MAASNPSSDSPHQTTPKEFLKVQSMYGIWASDHWNWPAAQPYLSFLDMVIAFTMVLAITERSVFRTMRAISSTRRQATEFITDR